MIREMQILSGELQMTSWTVDGNLRQFIDAIYALNSNAVVRVESDKLYCRALSSCNTMYGVFTLKCTVVGDNDIVSLPIGKIDSVLPNANVSIQYADNRLAIVNGKSRYKFTTLAPNVVKEPQVLNVPLTNMVRVSSKELLSAVKSIGAYYSKETFIPAIKLHHTQNDLCVSDNEDNVEVHIEGTTASLTDEGYVHQGYENLLSIVSIVAKLDEACSVWINSHKMPLAIELDNTKITAKYILAPRIMDEDSS
jgi:hypothetical protein